jgi:hypothetical protein
MAGRHKYQPTDEHRRQVMVMAGFGIQQDEIANLIECDPKTLRKYYRRELDTAATEANLRVAQSLYNLATKEKNIAACIWWTKARMGWKEVTDLNVAGNGKLDVEFRWRDEPAATAPAPKGAPPTIDAAAEDADGTLVVWQDDGGD